MQGKDLCQERSHGFLVIPLISLFLFVESVPHKTIPCGNKGMPVPNQAIVLPRSAPVSISSQAQLPQRETP